MRDADKLPNLSRRFRVFLHRLERSRARVEGRAGGEAVPAGELSGDAPSVRDAAAALVEAEGAAARGEGFDAADPDLALTLWLMGRCGDAAFAGLPGWGGVSAPALTTAWPPPEELSPDLGEQVAVLLEEEVPDPHRAELYLLAMAGGAGEFDMQECDDNGDGVTGMKPLPTAVDVTFTNLANGCSDTLVRGFTYTPADDSCVEAAGLNADFTFSVDGLTVTFTNASSGNPTDFLWDFGDGDQSPQENPVHVYAAGGTYVVTLEVGNAGGQTDSVSKPVTVSP